MATDTEKSAIIAALEKKKGSGTAVIEASDNQGLVEQLGVDMSATKFASAVYSLVEDGRVGRQRFLPKGLSSEGRVTRIWLIKS